MKLEKIANKLEQDWRKTNKESLVLAGSFGMGIILGRIGKSTGCWQIPAFLPTMDLLAGGRCVTAGTLPYLAGVASNYIPEICQAFT